MAGIMLAIGAWFGGTTGLTIALIFALGFNLVTYFFSDKIVLAMYRAKEASEKEYPKLHKMVEELSKNAGIPKPKIFIIPTMTPNAFATGRNPNNAVVAATQGIMELLSEKELRGVMAHELAHVKNRDILITTIAATMATVISYLAAMARWGAILGGGRDRDGGELFALIAMSILTPLLAMIIQLAISRAREYHADATGAKICKDPHSLADALEKLHEGVKARPLRGGNATTSSLFIVNPFSKNFVVSMLSTHPSHIERVKRLRNMN
jgi:heat shock protein HtpX